MSGLYVAEAGCISSWHNAVFLDLAANAVPPAFDTYDSDDSHPAVERQIVNRITVETWNGKSAPHSLANVEWLVYRTGESLTADVVRRCVNEPSSPVAAEAHAEGQRKTASPPAVEPAELYRVACVHVAKVRRRHLELSVRIRQSGSLVSSLRLCCHCRGESASHFSTFWSNSPNI